LISGLGLETSGLGLGLEALGLGAFGLGLETSGLVNIPDNFTDKLQWYVTSQIY